MLANEYLVTHNGFVVLFRFAEGGTQRQHQPLPRHLQNVKARRAGRRFQVGTGGTTKLQNLKIVVDQNGWRRELIQRYPVCLTLRRELNRKSNGTFR